jgi:hypothetical protein
MASSDVLPQPASPTLLARFSFIAWALAVILVVMVVTPVEWTHPYCNKAEDGPARPAFGFPLPDTEQSAGLSDIEFMPHIFLLNIVLLGALVYPIMGWAVRRLSVAGTFVRILIAVPGALLFLLSTAFIALTFYSAYPVMAIGAVYGDGYFKYRPLFMPQPHYDCMPSEFWFGPIKTPANLPKT